MANTYTQIYIHVVFAIRAGFDPAEMAKCVFISLREMERHFAQHLKTTPT